MRREKVDGGEGYPGLDSPTGRGGCLLRAGGVMMDMPPHIDP